VVTEKNGRVIKLSSLPKTVEKFVETFLTNFLELNTFFIIATKITYALDLFNKTFCSVF
jgi:hypothetical protein